MNKYISNKTLREFGFLIGFGFPLLIGLILPILWGHPVRYWTLCVFFPSLIAATFKPALLFYPYKFWMKLGILLGWINSKLILGLVFLFVLQPIAFLMKTIGYDPLRQKKTNKTSYREIRSSNKIDLKKIF